MKQQRTELRITGQLKSDFAKVEKKFLQSIRIPTGEDYYCQCTVWVPNTPGYSKAPKVVLTLNNYRDKIQVLFPSALDLMEFADVLQRFAASQIKEINNAHTEAVRDYTIFHELLLAGADKRAQARAAEEFLKLKTESNEQQQPGE